QGDEHRLLRSQRPRIDALTRASPGPQSPQLSSSAGLQPPAPPPPVLLELVLLALVAPPLPVALVAPSPAAEELPMLEAPPGPARSAGAEASHEDMWPSKRIRAEIVAGTFGASRLRAPRAGGIQSRRCPEWAP